MASSPTGVALSASPSMSSIVLPPRGQCIHIIDDNQPCQCQWFFPPGSPLLDQNICGHCRHGIHAHTDYVSPVVNHYPENQCAAYVQKTPLTQRCTCEAWLCVHVATHNSYCSEEPWTVLDSLYPDSNGLPSAATSNDGNGPFFPNTTPSSNYSTAMFSGDATDTPPTPTYMPSPNANPSYPYGDTVIFTPIPQPAIQTAITQIEGYSHSEVENSYGVQYQDDNFSVNVQDTSARFRQDYPFNAAHGAEAWAGQLE